VNDPEVRALIRDGLADETSPAPRVSTITKWSTRFINGKLKSLYLIGEEMAIVAFQRQSRCGKRFPS